MRFSYGRADRQNRPLLSRMSPSLTMTVFFTFLASYEILVCAVLMADTKSTVNIVPTDDIVEAKRPFISGRLVGDEVPYFYVRAVTGPMMNRSVCYVCRNGQRPVVMVLMQTLSPSARDLLIEIDRVVNKSRAYGLRCFGVLVSDEPMRDVSHVQTFAFDGKIEMPLTIGAPMVALPSCQNLNPDADVTVILYRQRKVVANYAFRGDMLDEDAIKRLGQTIRAFAVK
ncbi:MAG: hypothetical protein O2955_16615 [Planctomycetota bacterium]|nr:hypothetical protein [Planctomycetota bacterium]MDA1214137.1 hypothetical protein [Planctomycetota bacterium]